MKRTILTKKTLKHSAVAVTIAVLAISALLLTGCASSDAKSIALDHAGISAAEADAITGTLKIEDGAELYEVSFKTESHRYDYTVNAESGEVVRSQKTLIAKVPAGDSSGEYVASESALDAALADAGLSKDGVLLEKCKLDREDGRYVYEIKFSADGWEYEYDVDALSGEIVKTDKEKEKVKTNSGTGGTEGNKNNGTSNGTAYIGEDAAKAIALEHANIALDAAIFERTELEFDDGRHVYEVDFYAEGYEYEYEIDALSGEIVKTDREKEKVKAPAVTDNMKPSTPESDTALVTPPAEEPSVAAHPADQTAPSAESLTSSALITKEEAKAAALAHAGLESVEVTYVKTELDRDDGCYVYEVDFYHGGYEYEYDVDATSGDIIKHEKERESKAPATDKPATQTPAAPEAPVTPEEPSHTPPAAESKPESAAPEYIGRDRAKAIALEHAGISADCVRFDGVELDREKGRCVYEVDFEKGVYEYEYEIDALSGEIIKWEKDIDD